MAKIPKDIKNRMDRELRQYWDNIKLIEKLKKDIIEESNSIDGNCKSSSTSDPTYQKAIKLLSTRGITVLEERILYISKVINRLNNPFEKQVFNYIFKDNCNALWCESNKGISRSTYYNIYNKCILLAAEEFGEI